MKSKSKRLAHLTAAEDTTYNGAFEHYFNNVRRSNDRADRFAWRKCQEEFPRLRVFTGCHAKVSAA